MRERQNIGGEEKEEEETVVKDEGGREGGTKGSCARWQSAMGKEDFAAANVRVPGKRAQGFERKCLRHGVGWGVTMPAAGRRG